MATRRKPTRVRPHRRKGTKGVKEHSRKAGKRITASDLHEVEMELVYLLEENRLTRNKIIDKFTDLISKVR